MKEGIIQFNTVFVSEKIPKNPLLVELKEWSSKFQKNYLTPVVEGNYTGNLSFRSKEGFVITASGLKDKENLRDDSFVYVKHYEEQNNTFYVEGTKAPSSESVMHYLIYKHNKDVNAVFHGHNKLIVSNAEKLGLAVTEKEYESGTKSLAKEVLKVPDAKMIVLRNHGFVALGATIKEAGERALATLNEAKLERARQQSEWGC
jgi:L-fuculose-phosphate aldolase